MRLVFVLVLLIAAAACDDGDEHNDAPSSTSLVTGGCDGQLMIFLRPEETDANDLIEMAEEMSTTNGVEAYSTFDQDETYAEFQELFADTPQILDSVTPEVLPPSVRVQTNGDATVDEIKDRYDVDPRVREVVLPLDPALAEKLPHSPRPSCQDSPAQPTTTE